MPLALMPSLNHTAISASAGSGKTFQLTNRYLQLALAGAEPSTMLASTFTRLAAGQIRDRVMSRLAIAATDQAYADELATYLEMRSLSPSDAMQRLMLLARQMHVMQIRTLDSFFAAIVRAFAIELRIPPGADVVDEEQAASLRGEAVRLMLDEQDPQALVDLLRQLTQGASDRGIARRIDDAVASLYELWQEAPSEAWECVPQPPGQLPPPQLVAAIQRLHDVACPPGRALGKAFAKDCENARNWRWSEFLKNGLSAAVARGQTTYSSQPIPSVLLGAYEPVVRHAAAELIGRVREQTIATRELLRVFHKQYEPLKRRRRAITFSDLATALSHAQELGTLDDIAFRLDARLAHVMLDEFQDTSIVQWRALEPLVRECTSVAPPAKTFFCVGDVKQSIYRWRDAAPEVLENLPDMLRGIDGQTPITVRSLARSYRSAPEIMNAVNEVFSSLDRNSALADFQAAAAAWSRGFQRHETAKRDLAGYVALRYCRRAAQDEKADAVRLRAAAELAASLHRANPASSIAILTRTNKAVARLLYELGPSRLDVPVTGRGGGPLIDAAPVNVVLDLLQLADHPDDTTAAFNAAMSPLGGTVAELAEGGDQESTGGAHSWWNDDRRRRRISRAIRRQLLDDGYGRTIAAWARQAACDCDERELRRLRELVNLADAFDAAPPPGAPRAGAFIDLVESTKIADAQPSGRSTVQVMTIHQAKGLEFDAVILAELGGRLAGARNPEVVVERQGEIGPITRVCRYMNQETLALLPDLQAMFEGHRQRVVRENLSVLYVAMTRAIHALYMIVNPPDMNSDGSASQRDFKTMAGVVRCALAGGCDDPDTTPYERGNVEWHQTVPAMTGAAEQGVESDRIQLAPPAPGVAGRGAKAESASAEAARSHPAPLAQRLQVSDAEARDRGLAMHALFEHIQWLEDFRGDENRLTAIIRAASPRKPESWARAQARVFLKAIGNPAIAAALQRGKHDRQSLRVYREWPFARMVNGAVQTGSIDRLVVHLNSDCTARAATLIDFKTDDVAVECVRDHAERYRPQMEAYRAAAAHWLGIQESAVAMQVLFVAAGAAVDLR